MKKTFLVLFTVLVLLIFSGSCYAYEFEVATSDDLRFALDSADDNGESDTITLLPGTYETGGTYFFYSAIVPPGATGDLTIIGSGDVVLDAGNSGQVLNIASNYSTVITLRNLTVQNGVALEGAGANIDIETGTINVVNCSFKDNSAIEYDAGGLYAYIDNGGNIQVSSCDFSGNTANETDADGGGLYARVNSGDIAVIASSFDRNEGARYGGAAHLYLTNGELELSNCTFTNNIGSASDCYGGGAYIETDEVNCVVTNNIFSKNSSPYTAGGISLYSYNGGAYFASNYLEVNSADYGGGAYIYCEGDLTVENNIFTGNMGAEYGGGIAFQTGGWLEDAHHVIFRNNLVADNTTDYKGGGVHFISRYVASADIINNTITGNNVLLDTSFSYGGGLFVRCLSPDTDVSIYNNIIWGNTSYHYPSPADDIHLEDEDGSKCYFDLYNNLYSMYATDFSDGESVLSKDFNFNTLDPLFVSETDYHLQETSIAIDRGDNLAPGIPETDIEGNARIYGGTVDMGAYEYSPANDDDDDENSDDDDDEDDNGNGGGGGSCNIGAFIPSMLLLIAPLLFLVRKR